MVIMLISINQNIDDFSLARKKVKRKIPFSEQIFTCKFCTKEFKPKTSAHGKIFCSRSCSSKHRFSIEGSREKQSKKNKEWARKYGKKKTTNKKCLSCGETFAVVSRTKFCDSCGLYKYSLPLFDKIGLDKDLPLKTRGILAKEYSPRLRNIAD